MCTHRLAVDMMDNASALPTCPQDNNNRSRQIKIGLKSPTRLHDEADLKPIGSKRSVGTRVGGAGARGMGARRV
jgi:hypothetical protein